MATFETLKLDKGLYRTSLGINAELEKVDPSENYKGTSLENLDAYSRQLKRFDIKVKGKDSSSVDKFFQTNDSAVLFPEYVRRAVLQGMDEANTLASLIATHTDINGLDYRTLYSSGSTDEKSLKTVNEGAFIPTTEIKTKENLVRLHKHGRMLTASYEAIRFQRLDLFTVALRQIGTQIAREQVKDAINTIIGGDGNENPARIIQTKEAGTLTYADLVTLWNEFDPYTMNTMVCSPEVAAQILNLPEMKDAFAGLNFHATGKSVTPLGAKLIKNRKLDGGIVALDKNYALEMVTAGGVQTDFDKLIDRQLQRAAITEISGFAKIFQDASVIMSV